MSEGQTSAKYLYSIHAVRDDGSTDDALVDGWTFKPGQHCGVDYNLGYAIEQCEQMQKKEALLSNPIVAVLVTVEMDPR